MMKEIIKIKGVYQLETFREIIKIIRIKSLRFKLSSFSNLMFFIRLILYSVLINKTTLFRACK